MKWLADLCPSVRDLKETLASLKDSLSYWEEAAVERRCEIEELRDELALTRKARDEQTRTNLRLDADLTAARAAREIVHADLLAATDASARFRQMWEESAERAAKAERVAAFYRTAFGNVRRAVDNAATDGAPA